MTPPWWRPMWEEAPMLLEIENVSASYEGIRALDGVSLSVAQGEMVTLIGSNGAGKSTLLNCVSGIVRTTGGRIRFAGQDVTHKPAHAIARAGLLQVPEGRQIVAELTVRDNLLMGVNARAGRKSEFDLDFVHALFPVLEDRETQIAGSLSGGQQQMLAIGRALMAAPRMLLLDEPSLGLAPLIVDQVFAALARLSAAGLTILLVEQNAHRALAATSRAYILDRGRVVHEGASAELARQDAIITHYLGTEPAA